MPFTLRSWQQEDATSIAKAANNPKIAANLRNVFPSPYTLADAEWYVSDCINQGEERQLTRAIIIEGEAAGSIGVFRKEDVYEKSAELGYWLAQAHWGQGVMTKAVRQICREAFERFDILRIFAEPFADNLGSRRVLEKAGFTCEGTMRNGIFKNGRVHSYCIYALLREE
ncbi:MAG: GNAT family N-acetyltransferase [Oscillibacter sp.]|nr:GNAT family N-acetyltransferase [Oscillibacter sp.]